MYILLRWCKICLISGLSAVFGVFLEARNPFAFHDRRYRSAVVLCSTAIEAVERSNGHPPVGFCRGEWLKYAKGEKTATVTY